MEVDLCPETSLLSQNAHSSAALLSPTGKERLEQVASYVYTLSYLECKSMTTGIERMNNKDADGIHPREGCPYHQEQKPQEGHLRGKIFQ